MFTTVTTIWSREMRSFFSRPGGWLILLAATVPAAVAAGWMATLVSRGGLALRADEDPVSQFLGPNIFLMGTLLWLAPLLTMNAIADDRRRGTWELLVTSPATAMEIVVGKFLAAWTLISVCLVPWPLLLGALRVWNGKSRELAGWIPWFDGPGISFDAGLFWGGVIGLLVIAGTIAALGTLTSAIARRPLFAGFATATVLALLLATSLLPRVLDQWRVPADRYDWIQTVAVWGHLAEFSRGIIPVSRVIGHLSASVVLVWSAGQLCRRADG